MSAKTKSDGIVIKKFEPSLTDEVVAFLFEEFLPDEPLCRSFQLKPSEGAATFIKDALKMDVSFVAIDTEADNKLVGVRLSGLKRKEDENKAPEIDENSPKIFYMVKLLHDTFDQVDVFNKYNIDVILEGKMLSVHRDYRGREIAGRMMEATMNYMRENKIPLCYIPCTSVFTVKVLKKLDFESLLVIPYEEYLINGKRAFFPDEPHNVFTVCVKMV